MQLKIILLVAFLLALCRTNERIDNMEWRKIFHSWDEDDPKRHEICSKMLWPNGDEDLYTRLYKVEKLEASQEDYESHQINWFDMTYDNMAAVLDAAWKPLNDVTDTTKWWEKDWLSAWTMAYRRRYWNLPVPKEDHVEGFYFWGQYLSSGNTTKGGHVNKVIWLIEKRDGTEILGNIGNSTEDAMRITGKIYHLLCLGRYKDGIPMYKASRSEYVIYEPIADFQNNTDVKIPQYYFHGLNCPLIPNRPVFPEPGAPCVWAIRLGKYFNGGEIENTTFGGELGGENENYRQCIQKIFGYRTHTLQCFYSSIDDENWATVEELQAGEYNTLYSDKQVKLISDNIETFKSAECVGFTEKLDKANHYVCNCRADRKEYFDNPEKDWVWDPSEHQWTSKPYNCDDFVPERSGCLMRDENDYDECRLCRSGFILADNTLHRGHDCVTVDKVEDIVVPETCFSGAIIRGRFRCLVCKPLHAPTPSGECIFVNDNDPALVIPHCEHHLTELYKCHTCETGWSVSRTVTPNQQDVCIQYENKEFGKGYNGCGHLNPETVGTDNPECEWCKDGWHQMSAYNNGCFFKNFAELTEHQRLVLATRSDMVSNGIDEKEKAEEEKRLEEEAKIEAERDIAESIKTELMLNQQKKLNPCYDPGHNHCFPLDFMASGIRYNEYISANDEEKIIFKQIDSKITCTCTRCHYLENEASKIQNDLENFPIPYKNCILRDEIKKYTNGVETTDGTGTYDEETEKWLNEHDHHVCYNTQDLVNNKKLIDCEPKDFMLKEKQTFSKTNKECTCNECMVKMNWNYDCDTELAPADLRWPFEGEPISFDEKADFTPTSEVVWDTLFNDQSLVEKGDGVPGLT